MGFRSTYRSIRDWSFRAGSNHVIAFPTVVAAIATVCYTRYASGQLKTMVSQLRQMESQTRPWVGLDAANHPVRTSPLKFDKDGVGRLNCIVNVRNFGSYPAQNTLPTCDLVITQTTTSVTAK